MDCKIGNNFWGDVGQVRGTMPVVPPLSGHLLPTAQVLRLMVGVQVTEEQLESIADRTVQEADEDGDGAVSFLEFAKVRAPLGPGASRAGDPSTDGQGCEAGRREAEGEGPQGAAGPWRPERRLEARGIGEFKSP